jgi:hypothetical protein
MAQRALCGEGAGRGVALALAMVRYGELVDVPKNLANFAQSRPAIFNYAKKSNVRGVEGSKEPRNTSAFHPRADDLERKARRLGVKGMDTDDGRWFAQMGNAWIAALGVNSLEAAKDLALRSCSAVGETPFFERVLNPIIESRFGRCPEPHFSIPDFIPHEPA